MNTYSVKEYISPKTKYQDLNKLQIVKNCTYGSGYLNLILTEKGIISAHVTNPPKWGLFLGFLILIPWTIVSIINKPSNVGEIVEFSYIFAFFIWVPFVFGFGGIGGILLSIIFKNPHRYDNLSVKEIMDEKPSNKFFSYNQDIEEMVFNNKCLFIYLKKKKIPFKIRFPKSQYDKISEFVLYYYSKK